MISFVRVVIGVVLISSFMLQISANILLWTHFKWNINYISKVLCEKKDVPDSCCKGKCFLKKQVSKQEELPNTTNNTSKEQKSVKAQCNDTFIETILYTFNNPGKYSTNYTFYTLYFPLQNYIQTLEKPPRVSFCI